MTSSLNKELSTILISWSYVLSQLLMTWTQFSITQIKIEDPSHHPDELESKLVQ